MKRFTNTIIVISAIMTVQSMIKKHLHDNYTPKCKICKYIKDCEEIGDAYCYGLCEN